MNTSSDRPHPSLPSAIVCLHREAMACLFEIQFPEGSVPRAAALKAFDRIDQVEDQLSVYRATSLVSRLNETPVGEAFSLPPELFSFLVECHRLSGETGGAFDVTAGPLVEAWGFHRRQGRVPSVEEIARAREGLGMKNLALGKNEVTRRHPATKLNFGSIGKGYALDRVAEDLARAGARSYLLGAGQSSIRALGNLPGDVGWPLDLGHPDRPGTRLGRLRLRDQSVSTSGTAEQSFVHEGKRYGHLIDPRTGWPAEGARQVTAVAPSAAWAEALSTALFILGPVWAKEYCARNSEVGAIFVREASPTGVTPPPLVVGAIDFTPSAA